MARGKLNRVNSLNFSRLTTVFESLPLEIVLASSSARIKALKLPRETVSPWKREGRGSSRVLGEGVRWERWRGERKRLFRVSRIRKRKGRERKGETSSVFQPRSKQLSKKRRKRREREKWKNINKEERKKGRFSTSLRMVIRIAEEEEGIN